MSDTAQALQAAFEKLGELAHQYGPSALDTAEKVVQINAINTLTGIIGWGLVLGACVWLTFRARSMAVDDGDWWPGVFVCLALDLTFLIVVLIYLFDVWAWVGLFNPKLGLAHDVLTALMQKASS